MSQPVYSIGKQQRMRRLVNTFVVHCLNSIICTPAISEIVRLSQASAVEQASLTLTGCTSLMAGLLTTWCRSIIKVKIRLDWQNETW